MMTGWLVILEMPALVLPRHRMIRLMYIRESGRWLVASISMLSFVSP
jgi:hypothetical protein